MKILIIRHADPDYTTDTLTEKGRVEAELLADKLEKVKIDAFYTSPFGRARETCEATLKRLGRNAETLEWLREFSAKTLDPATGEPMVVSWDLLPSCWTRVEDFYDGKKWIDTDFFNSCGDGARGEYQMVIDGLDRLLARHGYTREDNCYHTDCGNEDTIALFCHFGVECVILSRLMGVSPIILWHVLIAQTSSVTTLVTEERIEGTAFFRCCEFGSIAHLENNGEPPSFAGRFCETFANKEQRH